MPIATADLGKIIVTPEAAADAGTMGFLTGLKCVSGVYSVITNDIPELIDAPSLHRLYRVVIYTTTNFTTAGLAGAINSLPIGAELLELRVSGGAVTGAAKWLKTGAATWAAV